MTYDEFKTYLTTFLWKTGDTVLANNLDNLIVMAHSDLNNSLKVQEMDVALSESVTDVDYTLPADYRRIRTVQVTELGELLYVQPALLYTYRDVDASEVAPVYSLSGSNTLLLAGPISVANPVTLNITYHSKVPDFATTDTSWLADNYLALYTYAVLRHSAGFLREDERVALWEQQYRAALMQINEDDAFHRARGVANKERLPRQASPVPYGNWRHEL